MRLAHCRLPLSSAKLSPVGRGYNWMGDHLGHSHVLIVGTYVNLVPRLFTRRLPAWVIELLDIECALCHVTGVQFARKICPYKSAILDFLQKLPFAFAQNVLGRVNFALINPPFCGDNFFTDTR